MRFTQKNSKFIPKGVEVILIDGNSKEEDINQFHLDLKDPEFKTPDGNPIIGFDFETFETESLYDQIEEDSKKLREFWKKVLERKIILKMPSKPPKTKKVIFNFPKIVVAGLSLCPNSKRTYYINLGHVHGKSEPVNLEIAYLLSKDKPDLEHVRQLQLRYVLGKIMGVPKDTEFAAHNSFFEYSVINHCGWGSIFNNSRINPPTRYRGGLICTYQLSLLSDAPKHDLKSLIGSIFRYEQPSLVYTVLMTHFLPEFTKFVLQQFKKNHVSLPKTEIVRLALDICKMIEDNKDNKTKIEKEHLDLFCSKVIDCYREHSIADYEDKKFGNKIRIEANRIFKNVIKNKFSLYYMPAEKIAVYGGLDAYWCVKLFMHQSSMLSRTVTDSTEYCSNFWDYYRKVEFPIQSMVAEMSTTGALINISQVKKYRSSALKAQIRLIKKLKQAVFVDLKKLYPWLFHPDAQWVSEEEVHNVHHYIIARKEECMGKKYHDIPILISNAIPDICWDIQDLRSQFNCKFCMYNDGHQKEVLFSILGVPVLETTEKGAASLTKYTLPRYSKLNLHTIKYIMMLKKIKTIQGLFLNPFIRLHDQETGRIHCQFGQNRAGTGRFAGSLPNLQQLSRKGKKEGFGREYNIRSLIIADLGHVFLSVDFSQIELRWSAHVSQDPNLLKAFLGDSDIHSLTTNLVLGDLYLGKPNEQELFKQYRYNGKTINFGVLYGISPNKLLAEFKKEKVDTFDLNDCKRFIDKWFETYSGLRVFFETIENQCLHLGYAYDDFGRRRYLDRNQREDRIGRQIKNTRIQGSCAALNKITMARIFWSEELRKLRVKSIATVHDELLLLVPVKNVLAAIRPIVNAFEDYDFSVPVISSVSIGWDYGNTVPLPEDKGRVDLSSGYGFIKNFVKEKYPAISLLEPDPNKSYGKRETWI